MADLLRATSKVPGFLEAADIHLVESSKRLANRQRQVLAGHGAAEETVRRGLEQMHRLHHGLARGGAVLEALAGAAKIEANEPLGVEVFAQVGVVGEAFPKHARAAVKALLKGDLQTHAISEGTKALEKFQSNL